MPFIATKHLQCIKIESVFDPKFEFELTQLTETLSPEPIGGVSENTIYVTKYKPLSVMGWEREQFAFWQAFWQNQGTEARSNAVRQGHATIFNSRRGKQRDGRRKYRSGGRVRGQRQDG
jgi:hypothetical protein